MSDKDNWHNRLNEWIKGSHKNPWTGSLKDEEWRGEDTGVIWIAHNKVHQSDTTKGRLLSSK